ncbi:hypothetical protein HMPREF0454_03341 [Hafnia alvei ATCC 51873]|uniref:Uncharacterized protein n=1 Tax=Hafnia alvei ATCC 51873 TaxID=1002364 RepID=G9Y9S3_HAFAL|nr:hypothetical protein HMPREF0454_03341 [Hafnia alvei ATCC 51873]
MSQSLVIHGRSLSQKFSRRPRWHLGLFSQAIDVTAKQPVENGYKTLSVIAVGERSCNVKGEE